MKRVFAPGCALMLYKPELAEKLHLILNKNLGEMELLTTCCKHDPQLKEKTEIINICPGCDKRFRNDYENSSTISLWEVIAQSNFFDLPNYHGKQMTIIDACPTRDQERVHNAIRTVLRKMNIVVVEPQNTRSKSTCCGDSFYGVIPVEKVKELMVKRTSEMPLDDVVVYCVSCIKSVYIGGKKPKYLVDLLFANETLPKTYEPDEWHKEIDDYIEKH
ncbi:MAG: (Fe-S)-binding protein [Bacteroidales bacterium]|nr:(Fe-S)-binding protein [Bacteroidales bacterium]